MKIPKGMTEDQVVNQINKVCDRIALKTLSREQLYTTVGKNALKATTEASGKP